MIITALITIAATSAWQCRLEVNLYARTQYRTSRHQRSASLFLGKGPFRIKSWWHPLCPPLAWRPSSWQRKMQTLPFAIVTITPPSSPPQTRWSILSQTEHISAVVQVQNRKVFHTVAATLEFLTFLYLWGCRKKNSFPGKYEENQYGYLKQGNVQSVCRDLQWSGM